MTNVLLDGLRDDISSRRVLVIAGAGVSLASTNARAEASWTGLLANGIDYATAVNPTLPKGWKERVGGLLEWGIENGHTVTLVTVAEQVVTALDGVNGGRFASWLRDTVGNFRVIDPTILNAIAELGLPIATTNYDTLLEQAMHRSSCTWEQPARTQLALRGDASDIVHLHGVWDQPSSVILGSQSYGRLLGDGPAQALQQAVSAFNSLLFVGCGGTVSDPNFENLRQWLATMLHGSQVRHYHLCLSSEVGAVASMYDSEQIYPISYGDAHGDLAGFLQSLPPSYSLTKQPPTDLTFSEAPTRALESLSERVRADTVLAEHFSDLDSRPLLQILIPPVLLPVTHEQFASSYDMDDELRPKRCDPEEDARQNDCLLVAADEYAGLTSALAWLLSRAQSYRSGLVPVMVDFRQFGSGHRPLEKQVRKELMLAGVLAGRNDPLPALALAIDNINPRTQKIFERTVEELKSGDAFAFTVLGCRQGLEAEIWDAISAAKVPAKLRYVGKMSGRDAARMAKLVEPARATRLASRAMALIAKEHLPRTPLTVGLLLSVLLHGESLLATASETALLDAFVNLLLGRGDPHDDARFSLDSLERSDILATLAEQFVQADNGSMSEAEVVQAFAEYFDSVGWNEDPLDVLDNLKRRHLLAVRAGQVRFTQSTFLHLFAAKRAIESAALRRHLYERPLYYAPIIRHYAALTRNDPEVLLAVERLLGAAHESGKPSDGVFGKAADATELQSLEDLVKQLALGAKPEPDPHTSDREQDGLDDEAWPDDYMLEDDADPSPFPIENMEDAPPALQVLTAVGLVSTVLRDSELVKDLDLKQRLLQRTLSVWGTFVELLEKDADYKEFSQAVARAIADYVGIEGKRQDEFVREFCESAPVLVGFGGMAATLASRKLTRSLDRCFEEAGFIDDVGASVMGALLGFDIQEPGWTKVFVKVQEQHADIRAVTTVLYRFALTAYCRHTLSHADAERLHDFLVAQMMRRLPPANEAGRKSQKARLSQRLKQNRALEDRSRVPSGLTFFDQLPPDQGEAPGSETLEKDASKIIEADSE